MQVGHDAAHALHQRGWQVFATCRKQADCDRLTAEGLTSFGLDYENETSRVILKPLNILLSQVHTVNNQYTDLLRLIIMRLYLIRSYRGRCHAIGKPVRGQRT